MPDQNSTATLADEPLPLITVLRELGLDDLHADDLQTDRRRRRVALEPSCVLSWAAAMVLSAALWAALL